MMSRFRVMVCAAVMALLLSGGGPFAAAALDGQEPEETKETQIAVYTYSGEAYLINGTLTVSQHGNGDSEGTWELQADEMQILEADQSHISDEMWRTENPVSLTVYMGDQIYGFFGSSPVPGNEYKTGDRMELYGHLVGYFDGVTNYSS